MAALRRIVWTWLVVPGLVAAQPSGAAVTPAAAQSAPLRLLRTGDIGALPLVQVEIDGQRGWWLVDTGASTNAISPRFAVRVGARRTGTTRVESIGGSREVHRVDLPPLIVGNARYEGLSAIELDIDEYFARAGAAVHGILGRPFLERQPVTFDFAEQRLVLGAPEHAEKGIARLPLSSDDGLPVLSLSIGERLPGRFLFDTGNPGALVLFAAGGRRLLQPPVVLPALTVSELGGTVTAHFALFDVVTTPGLTLRDVPAAIESGARARRGGHFDRLDGSVGVAPFLGTRVTLDLRSSILSIDASRMSAVPGGFGFMLAQSAQGPLVAAVLDASPAAAAGVRPGDRLVAVDDAALDGGVAAIWAALAARDEADFRFARADGERSVRLQRRAFFPRLR